MAKCFFERTIAISRILSPKAAGCGKWRKTRLLFLAIKLLHLWHKAIGVEISTVDLGLRSSVNFELRSFSNVQSTNSLRTVSSPDERM